MRLSPGSSGGWALVIPLILGAACSDPEDGSDAEDGSATPADATATATGYFEPVAHDLAPMQCGRPDSPTILEVNGGGVALFDGDDDGDLDLLLVIPGAYPSRDAVVGGTNRLYRNDSGSFVDVTAGSGVDVPRWCNGVAVGDVDGDGRRDLYLTCLGSNVLLRNIGGLRFEPLTDAAGAAGGDEDWSTSALFVDLEPDGDPDLYVVNYLRFDPDNPPMHGQAGRTCLWKGHVVMCGPQGLPAQPDRVFVNEGGHFIERTRELGFEAPAAYGLGVVDGDFDDDGVPDIYVSNDSVANYLFTADGPGTWREGGVLSGAALSGRGREQAGMGVAAGDTDGDGDEDLLVTNFSMETNALYRNLGGGRFADEADLAGLGGPSRRLLGWGVALVDVDLDGSADVIAANGHVYPQADEPGTDTSHAQPDLLCLNDGSGRFRSVPWVGAEPAPSRALAVGDLDGDRVADLVVTRRDGPLRILRGTASPLRALQVVLAGGPGNPDGVGSRLVWIDSQGRRAARVRASGGFQAYGDPRPVFAWRGTGTLLARFPDGRTIETAVDAPGRVTLSPAGQVSAALVEAGPAADLMSTTDPTTDSATASPAVTTDIPVPVAPTRDLTPDEWQHVKPALKAMAEDRFEAVLEHVAPLLAGPVVHPDVQFIAGSAAFEMGLWGEATERLAAAIAAKPIFTSDASALGFALIRLGEYSAAEATFHAIIAADDTREKAHYGLGLLDLTLGRLDQAEQHLGASLALEPDYLKARFALSRLREQQGHPEQALELVIGVLSEQPAYAEGLLLQARVLEELGRLTEADEVLARRAQVYRLLEEVSNLRQRVWAGEATPVLCARLVELLLQVGDRRQAVEVRRECAARFPEDPRFHP